MLGKKCFKKKKNNRSCNVKTKKLIKGSPCGRHFHLSSSKRCKQTLLACQAAASAADDPITPPASTLPFHAAEPVGMGLQDHCQGGNLYSPEGKPHMEFLCGSKLFHNKHSCALQIIPHAVAFRAFLATIIASLTPQDAEKLSRSEVLFWWVWGVLFSNDFVFFLNDTQALMKSRCTKCSRSVD